LKTPRIITSGLLALLFSLLLAGCASLPNDFPRVESWKLDSAGTRLAGAYDTLKATHPGQSGAFPLGEGIDALAARVGLIRAADRTLDVQYYIWHDDESGRLLLRELLDAADRGVRVRLLLDDLGVGRKNDDVYIWLDSHPNFSVSLFNPITTRESRTLGLLSGARRLNHRMHNKSMTADGTMTVVGGRNIGDEYFSLNEMVNFADLDVLAIGPVADQVSDSFDIFWNSPATIPISALHDKRVNLEKAAEARDLLRENVDKNSADLYQAMHDTLFSRLLQSQEFRFYWGNILAFNDTPGKMQGADKSDLLLTQLRDQLGHAFMDLLIVSPYFVPGKQGVGSLTRAVRDGARVRVVTNSLASTDVGAVHAGYKKSRRKLIEGGVELFEMIPSLAAGEKVSREISFYGSSKASLHAKTFVIDRQKVFIGSMNLDPRSIELNTEIGLLIESPELASRIESRITANIASACYAVVLESKHPERPDGGSRLVWIEQSKGGEIRFYKDPQTSAWQRFIVNLIGLLPVDSQL